MASWARGPGSPCGGGAPGVPGSSEASDVLAIRRSKLEVFSPGTSSLEPRDEAILKRILSRHAAALKIDDSWSPMRVALAEVLMSETVECALGLVIVIHLCFAVHETNVAVMEGKPPHWHRVVSIVFVCLYSIELAARSFVMRRTLLKSSLDVMDVAVVCFDVASHVLELALGELPSVGVLRIFRLVRLIRAFRILTTFRELYIMLHSFVGAMKAICWASAMILVVLTIWSMICVELLHPLNVQLALEGKYDSCDRCSRCYESVFQANLTLFQQIIAGDGLGSVSVLMMERHPWTVLIYIPAFITVGMGLMNLTLTAIVDRAAEARAANEQERLQLKLSVIRSLFSQMDVDCSGCVTYAEFMQGIEEHADLAKALSLLGIRIEDVKAIFDMMDQDGSGTVSCDEFTENLSKMKNEESFVVLLYVKHFMNSMEYKLKHMHEELLSEIQIPHTLCSTSSPPGARLTSKCCSDGLPEVKAPREDKISDDSPLRIVALPAKHSDVEPQGPHSVELNRELEAFRRRLDENVDRLLQTVSRKWEDQPSSPSDRHLEYIHGLADAFLPAYRFEALSSSAPAAGSTRHAPGIRLEPLPMMYMPMYAPQPPPDPGEDL